MSEIIERLQVETLNDVASDSTVAEHFSRLYDQHQQTIQILRNAMTFKGGVVEFDISDFPITGHNKFIPYYVFPESIYTVGVSLEPARAKVSVGTNPWTRAPLRHNLAEICERYGGGGHAVVAAISFQPEELPEARRVAGEIASKLRNDP